MLMIRKAAVLGAGRMGTAVAAHLANAGIPTLLLDMAPTELTEDEQKKKLTLESKAVRNRLATTAIATALKGRPAAFAHPSRADLLTHQRRRIHRHDRAIHVAADRARLERLLNRTAHHQWVASP